MAVQAITVAAVAVQLRVQTVMLVAVVVVAQAMQTLGLGLQLRKTTLAREQLQVIQPTVIGMARELAAPQDRRLTLAAPVQTE